MTRIRTGSAMLLLAFSITATACSSGGVDVADYNRLQERVTILEQQLTEQSQKLEEQVKQLEAISSNTAAVSQGEGDPNHSAAPGDNGSANKGDGVLITFDQYDQLEVGMTYKEATDILGGEGMAISESDDMVVYSYMGKGSSTGANAVLTFSGGKLLNKAQAGLE